jgi:hypothetical protein
MEDWIWIDSKKAFEEALEKGILSDKEGDKNFVGDFMYMGTKKGVHQFKHILTRKYGFDLQSLIEAG